VKNIKPLVREESAAAKLIKDKSLLYNTEQRLQQPKKPKPVKLASFERGFLDELEKIAAAADDLEGRRKVELAAAAGVPAASLLGLTGASRWQFKKNLVPREEAYKLYTGMTGEPVAKGSGMLGEFLSFKPPKEIGRLPVMTADNPLAYAMAPIEGEKTLVTPIGEKLNPYAIMHEAGHGKGRTAKDLTRLTKFHLMGKLAPLSALGVLPFAGSEKAETAGYVAGGLGGAASLPMLTEEARASARALKAMKGVKGLSRAKALKTLLPAFGTYGSVAALATLSPMALGRYFAAAKAKKVKEG